MNRPKHILNIVTLLLKGHRIDLRPLQNVSNDLTQKWNVNCKVYWPLSKDKRIQFCHRALTHPPRRGARHG